MPAAHRQRPGGGSWACDASKKSSPLATLMFGEERNTRRQKARLDPDRPLFSLWPGSFCGRPGHVQGVTPEPPPAKKRLGALVFGEEGIKRGQKARADPRPCTASSVQRLALAGARISVSAAMPSPACRRRTIARLKGRLRFRISCTRERLPIMGSRSRALRPCCSRWK